MANLSSSKKMIRKINKRTERNKSLLTRVKTYLKRFDEAVANKDGEAAKLALKEAQPKIMSLAQKGIIHKKNASRKISRLSLLTDFKELTLLKYEPIVEEMFVDVIKVEIKLKKFLTAIYILALKQD